MMGALLIMVVITVWAVSIRCVWSFPDRPPTRDWR
jgi:hypothetical protein